MEEKKTPLIFTHIPKAAGNTLNGIIQRQLLFKAGTVFNARNVRKINDFIALPESFRRKLVLVRGHLYYGVHEHCPQPMHYFTMLREPISRAMSEYNYIHTIPHHPNFKELHENQYTVKQLLESGLIKNMDNCQVRFLCGIGDIGYGEVTEQHLQMAVDNITLRYESVGILEMFDESILAFARTFNWSKPYYIKKNVSTKVRANRSDLDAATLQLLDHYNRFDKVLYETGRELLLKQIRDAGPGFAGDLAEFRRKNAALQPYIKTLNFLTSYAVQAKYYLGIEKS